tara:strand:+ start:266 stop:499 length:234 start_codon:yes stop_codon:yes gene_type:complete
MKVGDLIKFKKTCIVGIVTEVYDKTHPVGERVKVFSTYEDDETGEQVQVNQWYPLDYLLICSEPADFNHSAMTGGKL